MLLAYSLPARDREEGEDTRLVFVVFTSLAMKRAVLGSLSRLYCQRSHRLSPPSFSSSFSSSSSKKPFRIASSGLDQRMIRMMEPAARAMELSKKVTEEGKSSADGDQIVQFQREQKVNASVKDFEIMNVN